MSWPKPELLTSLTDHQRAAYSHISKGRFGVLTGGPGTGKTFTSSEIINNIDGVVCAAAPTGKARVRLAEALEENGVTKISRIGTIHSLLGVDYKSEGFDYTNPSFVYNSTNPLNCDCLVLDESGNIPTSLLASALRAVPPDGRVLFIGDPDQLAPVGHGKPLIDMIEGGIPHAKLDEVHRYAGRIAHVCKQINNGKSPVFTPHDSIDWQKKECPENCIFIESSHTHRVLENMCKIVKKMIEEYGACQYKDVQVICAVNTKSGLSREEVNKRLRAMLNTTKDNDLKFKAGDKIICRKNHKFKVENFAEDQERYTANGEIGVVEHVNPSSMLCRFGIGTTPVRVPRRFWDDIQFGYAITGHSSQGSQWKYVVSIVDDYTGANLVCSRQYWYTVCSRASRLQVLVGRRAIFLSQIRRMDSYNRRTLLEQKIKERLHASTKGIAT